MNTFHEFTQKTKKAVQEYLGEEFCVETSTFSRNNGVRYQGLTIMEGGSNVSPAICMESLYAEYQKDGDMGTVLKNVMEIYQSRKLSGNIDMEFFSDYGKIREKVLFRLVGYEKNHELLQNVPHVCFLDMAATFYCTMFHEVMGNMTIPIRNTECDRWGVSAADLYECAKRNTPRMLPGTLRDIQEVLSMVREGNESEYENKMFVLTNTLQSFGAACMLYPQMIQNVSEQWNCNSYILPSSVHEVLLLPDCGKYDVEQFRRMVYEINHTQLEQEDILTDSVYYYDLEEGKIRLL